MENLTINKIIMIIYIKAEILKNNWVIAERVADQNFKNSEKYLIHKIEIKIICI